VGLTAGLDVAANSSFICRETKPGRPTRDITKLWLDNNEMDIREIRCEDVNQDEMDIRVQRRTFVITDMKLNIRDREFKLNNH
jgi:hypothetical protein